MKILLWNVRGVGKPPFSIYRRLVDQHLSDVKLQMGRVNPWSDPTYVDLIQPVFKDSWI